MTSLELLQEIDAWLSFNNSPSKEQISELRNDIKKHISEQLNILHVSNNEVAVCDNCHKNPVLRYDQTTGLDLCSDCYRKAN
jgi:hypothetical protein